MTTSGHDTGWYNVRGSLVAWLTEGISTYKPALVAVAVVAFDTPETALNCPRWSIHSLGNVPSADTFQGNYTGDGYGERKVGLLEVGCWVSRRDTNWRAQLAQMADAVYRTVYAAKANGAAVIIKDFYTDAAAPTNTAARIIIEGAEDRNPPVDPNPDIERRRIIITYNWVERA